MQDGVLLCQFVVNFLSVFCQFIVEFLLEIFYGQGRFCRSEVHEDCASQ